MKWKLFAPKRKTTTGQPNSGNQLLEEIVNYKVHTHNPFQ
jgi:hypothetical protein